jgi:hypothetical protein
VIRSASPGVNHWNSTPSASFSVFSVRIRVIRKPTQPSIDGVRLDQFYPGAHYEVGTLLGAVMLAEGWAEPTDSQEPEFATFAQIRAITPRNPPNLIREIFPPYYDTPAVLAADRRRTPRPPKNR